ncbi:MAG: hypothetical protein CL581_10485 [Alteromonadaceae bacterium]|nr:hypothetical protein [Alteromonadaceae bacterium]MBH86771.1 hypothetical protein [Alteromonadaceae bacterium]|tara:strand:+ start:54622 stop:55170 length:549 start_codon:yes stop_codon:yes gene_type:complete
MRKYQSGFTLIELMVTVAILVIIITIAVPSFQSVIASRQLIDARDRALSAIQYAKGEAVGRNRAVSICPSSDGASCGDSSNWADGWLIVLDNNETGAVSIDETIRVADGPEARAVTMTNGGDSGAVDYIRFLPNGFLNTNPPFNPLYFGFCDPDGDVAAHSILVAGTTGQVRTGTETEASCP